jgi:hypothetical protein
MRLTAQITKKRITTSPTPFMPPLAATFEPSVGSSQYQQYNDESFAIGAGLCMGCTAVSAFLSFGWLF